MESKCLAAPQRVSGLCPDLPGRPREGRKKGGLTEGERWP